MVLTSGSHPTIQPVERGSTRPQCNQRLEMRNPEEAAERTVPRGVIGFNIGCNTGNMGVRAGVYVEAGVWVERRDKSGLERDRTE